MSNDVVEDGLPEYMMPEPNAPTMDFIGIRWFYDMAQRGTKFVRGGHEFFLLQTQFGYHAYLMSVMDLYSESKTLTVEGMIDGSLSERLVTPTGYPWEWAESHPPSWIHRLRKQEKHGLPQWYETDDLRSHKVFDTLETESRMLADRIPMPCIDGPCEGDVEGCRPDQTRVFVNDHLRRKHIYEVCGNELKFVRTSERPGCSFII